MYNTRLRKPLKGLLTLCGVVLLFSCSAHAPPRDVSAGQDSAGADSAAATCCTLVLIKTGPMSGKLSEADNAKAFAGHFENMGRLANARQLLVAGPYDEPRHDPLLRGLFVLATANRSQAEQWAATDPTTLAGVFTLEFHELITDAPLLAALERHLAADAQHKAQGTTPKPAEQMRGYVLLTAEAGDRAERVLAPLKRSGGVLMLGRLDGTRAFAILDAETVAAATTRFSSALAGIGAHTLDAWYASREIAKLAD